MSKLPFVALFDYLVGIIAPEFFDSGLPCLETGICLRCFILPVAFYILKLISCAV